MKLPFPKRYLIFTALFGVFLLVRFASLTTGSLAKKKGETLQAELVEKVGDACSGCQAFPSSERESTSSPTPLASIVLRNGEEYLIKNNEIFLKEVGEGEEQLTTDGGNAHYKKSSLKLSPGQKYLAYFQDLPKEKEEEMSDRTYYWENYMALRLIEVSSRSAEEVYRGSFKIGEFEWLSDKEISVWVGCGTECSYLEVIDIPSKSKRQLMYGVGYKWSPNKKYVLAYHYAIRPGIEVGDKFGKTLFKLSREYPVNSMWYSDHKAVWSPDSTKIAVIINKDGRAELEILVYDIRAGFKMIFKRDLEHNEFSDLVWDNERIVYHIGGAEKEIFL